MGRYYPERRNYKNILQVKIQKEFKITPHYVIMEQDADLGYKMGVYLCFGQPIHQFDMKQALNISQFSTFAKVQERLLTNDILLLFLGEGQHKIKRKAEQIACSQALTYLKM